MAGMPAPWGAPRTAAVGNGELSFVPVDPAGTRLEPENPAGTRLEPGDQTVEDPTKAAGGTMVQDPTRAAGGQQIADPTQPGKNLVATPRGGVVGDIAIPEHGAVGAQTIPTGGARTHYALDVVRGGQPVVRLVVVDTSLKSIAASNANQNPVEEQLGWLREVLKRPAGVRAVVLTNTPTFSYGPGATTDTMDEASQFEQILMENRVDMVVSGRVGWNARYWAHAPGVHEPCSGQAYQDQPSEQPSSLCGAPEAPTDELAQGAAPAAAALSDLGAPVAPLAGEPSEQTGFSPLPFVIAASAGGVFGPNGENQDGEARDGFWRGYTVVRLDPSGRFAPVVEQRPVFDWVGLRAQEHMLRPGQKMTLRGYGREPLGNDQPARYIDRIDTPAITHRYDLVMADPQRPYVPLEDANGDYVAVPPSVATVDRITGAVRAGKGRAERTYTIGIFSIGDKAATWPIAFEPRRSFTAQRARTLLPPLPRAARAPAAQAPIRVSEPPTPPPAQPPPSPASPFSAQTLQPPQPPQIPSLPATSAPPAPAPPQLQVPPPPVPPAPPNVPAQQQPIPLALNAKLQPISLVPSVNPPAPPPVNPAPPAGGAARKEAKQRQAAAAKSEEGEGAEKAGVDLAQGTNTPEGVQATRRDVDRPMPATRRAPDRPTPSFSPLATPGQASAWTRGALYGGGLSLAALAFSAAWLIGRPRPRRRTPDLPAPAFNRRRA
jgi:hypothetical protein